LHQQARRPITKPSQDPYPSLLLIIKRSLSAYLPREPLTKDL
jgi:hypothetical protein